MAKNQDALFRQWNMLRQVPRYPQKASAQVIRNNLIGEGFEVTERTVQRDLIELSGVFPLQCDDREKPYGWSWQREAASFDLPSLSSSEALMVVLAEKHLANLLPSPMLDQLQRLFKAAKQRLDSVPTAQKVRPWLEKVQSVSPTQALIAPTIDDEVHRAVTEALLLEVQLTITYRRRNQDAPAEYRIHPLAIVQRGPMLYLCCRFFDYDDPRTIALNRITTATVLAERAEYPKNFSLDKTVETGFFDFGKGKQLRFEASFQATAGAHLFETPLSKDQEIIETPDGRLLVTATVADTPQLQWWLLGLGTGVEVLAPRQLRTAVKETIEGMASMYLREH